jgi:uncharacterized protein YabN with tetrapyrrole methylase and pyrophosphatase domain
VVFDFGDVAEGFLHKMKSRHPHLYEGGERQSWEGMKARKRDSIVDGLPADLPPCTARSDRRIAPRVGFDWPDASGPAEKVEEELPRYAPRSRAAQRRERGSRSATRGAGDLLFAVVNLCRKQRAPVIALDRRT